MNHEHPMEGVYFFVPDCINPLLSGHPIKIGRSNNVLKRAASLQTGSIYKLRQLWFLYVRNTSAKELELQLHEEFSQFHFHHEWFVIPTAHWRLTVKTMRYHYDDCLWMPLINNGPLRRCYAHPRLSSRDIDMLVETTIKELNLEVAA
jgi:hypothetical protein